MKEQRASTEDGKGYFNTDCKSGKLFTTGPYYHYLIVIRSKPFSPGVECSVIAADSITRSEMSSHLAR